MSESLSLMLALEICADYPSSAETQAEALCQVDAAVVDACGTIALYDENGHFISYATSPQVLAVAEALIVEYQLSEYMAV